MIKAFLQKLFNQVDASSLAAFRIGFGAILVFECVNYALYLCPECYYLSSDMLFKYQYFEWVSPLPGKGLRILWLLMAVAAAMVMVGLYYRISMLMFTLGFTYMFLLDQSEYLNHFYMVILFCVLMIFIPANRYWSIDARRNPEIASPVVPNWTRFLLGAQLEIILVWAGIVKLNPDWLRLEPLRMWLTQRSQESAEIFQFLTQDWGIAIGAYGAIALHLIGAPLLLLRRTRLPVLILYALFHISNSLVFNIGIFPWMTFWATLLLFDPDWPRQFWRWLRPQAVIESVGQREAQAVFSNKHLIIVVLISIWLAAQTIIPMRNWWLPGNVAWNEVGHRFSWRMKLRSKVGSAVFVVTDAGGNTWTEDPANHLTHSQHWKMRCIPDMLWQYAQFLSVSHGDKGTPISSVTADVMCSLNGRSQARLVNPTINLLEIERNHPSADWLLPLDVPLN